MMVEQLPRTGKAGVCRLSNYHGRPEAYFARWTSFSGRPLAADVLAVISSHVESVVLLSQLKQKPDDYINVTIELDDVDITSAETKATYDEIKKYVAEHNAGMKVSNLYISQVKRKCAIEGGQTLCVATRRMDCLQDNSTTAATDLELVPSPNLPKNEDSRQPQCPEDKESAIVEALKHFKMNS